MADEKKSAGAEEKKLGSMLTKVFGTVFGAIVAPIAVAVGIKFLSPAEHHPTTPVAQPERLAEVRQEDPSPRPSSPRAQRPRPKKDALPLTGAPLVQFNGKDLSGFYTYLHDSGRDKDPRGVFTVRDRVLRVLGGEEAYLATQQAYDTYTLTLEYRWGEPLGRNTGKGGRFGVVIHADGADGPVTGRGEGHSMYGILCRLKEGNTGDIVLLNGGPRRATLTVEMDPKSLTSNRPNYVFQPGGTPTKLVAVSFIAKGAEAERPHGEWNELRIFCTPEPAIHVYLNGTQVNSGREPRPSKGKILIQSGNCELFLRKIEVVALK